MNGSGESDLGTSSNGLPRVPAASCRSLFGEPPVILSASVIPSSEEAVCDFTFIAETYFLSLGASLRATPGPLLLGGTYTAVHLEASITDRDSTPSSVDVSQVTAQYVYPGTSFVVGTDLLDDGGSTQEAVHQYNSIFPEDCVVMADGTPDCRVAVYRVNSGDLVAGDALFTRSQAFITPGIDSYLPDCIAKSNRQNSTPMPPGAVLQFTIVARDREGNLSVLPATPDAAIGASTYSCSGDPCMCCFLETADLHSGCVPVHLNCRQSSRVEAA